jgi:three-Cys-motif partner protein
MTTTDEKYWDGYDGLQYVKHKILESYLAGWFPILSSWQGKVLYIDCNAGRGKHETGQYGSPIRALNQLLHHKNLDGILSNTKIIFHFFEINQYNCKQLDVELRNLGPLPENIFTFLHCSDYVSELKNILNNVTGQEKSLAPSFAFIDPYGYALSMDLLNRILTFPSTELLITFMLRYVDLAMTHEDQLDNMNRLFGTSKWQEIKNIDNYEERVDNIVNLFSEQLNAKYVTKIYMRSKTNIIKYVLFHATNHQKGRELIKEVLWKVCPDGTFSASEKTNPNQLILFVPEPDLNPLKRKLLENFSQNSVKMAEIYTWLSDTLYLPRHIHQVISKMRKGGEIEATEYMGRFGFKKNPRIKFLI